MTETIINSEALLIIFSGVVIFTAQRLISDLWISPHLEFKKSMGRIDVLLIRYEFLSDHEYGSSGGGNDEDIVFFRQEIRNTVVDLVGKFRALFFIERWWLEYIRRININQTKPQLLYLSQIISTNKDVIREVPDAKKLIEGIRGNLKFEPFEIDYEKIISK